MTAEQLHFKAVGSPTKRCSRCGIVKPWSGFYLRTKNGKKRPTPFCRKCAVNRVLKWKRECPEQYAAHKRERISIHRAAKERVLGKPVRCAICGDLFADKRHQRGPAFDHNHETGKARGWLCPGCNMGLGALGDNPRLLRAAAEYLERRGHYATRTVIK